MPTLNWIGKDKVVNHHQDVPYRILEKQYTYKNGEEIADSTSENKIIHGDNLEALKSLLPQYEGKIDCIYIDPPYNTGNEGWAYNDNVNSSKIKKWLGDVVGKEGEDLSRHDKWLCMMYPRIKLLNKMLANDGIIFISIDDNEYQSLKYLMDEIFSRKNFLCNFVWRTDGNFDNQAKIKINHEYILCYSKNSSNFQFPDLIDPNVEETSKLYKDRIVNTIVKNGKKNPVSKVILPIGFPANFEEGVISKQKNSYPIIHNDIIVKDFQIQNETTVESGWSSKNLFELFINNGLSPVIDTKNQETIFYLTENGAIESEKKRGVQSHVISSLSNLSSTQNMSNELKKIGVEFDFPKPVTLIKYLISLLNKKDAIILDSFAGSASTAEAVLQLNSEDNGQRSFILIEMLDYVEEITTTRVKRVIEGYGNKSKTIAGEFSFYNLGKPLFGENQLLNEDVGLDKILEYVWYSETKTPYQITDEEFLLGTKDETAYYFYYQKNNITTLDLDFLRKIKSKANQYIIYADNCLLDKTLMEKYNIIFKKIPRDISRF